MTFYLTELLRRLLANLQFMKVPSYPHIQLTSGKRDGAVADPSNPSGFTVGSIWGTERPGPEFSTSVLHKNWYSTEEIVWAKNHLPVTLEV